MGSFNEVCALSHMSIECGNPVRLLFLTQNPYVKSDQHEAQRGCYHYDNWFVRTPPIKGVYDDYGNCKFTEDVTTNLIVECFQKDVVERPFGFNRYHAHDVTKTKGIHHFLQAAYEGRLLVSGNIKKEIPKSWPTWEKLHKLFKENNILIQSESNDKENGFNAQPVIPGIVAVTYDSYTNETKNLKKIKELIETTYDCKLVYRVAKSDPYLLVTAKGAFKNPNLLCETGKIKEALNTYPTLQTQERNLPVLTVMIREDVWQTYCNVEYEDEYYKLKSIDEIKNNLKSEVEKSSNSIFLEFRLGLIGGSSTLPFMTTPLSHLKQAIENNSVTEELMQNIAELVRVEIVMARLNHPWHIPSLGGQDGEWQLRTKIFSALTNISKEMGKE